MLINYRERKKNIYLCFKKKNVKSQIQRQRNRNELQTETKLNFSYAHVLFKNKKKSKNILDKYFSLNLKKP